MSDDSILKTHFQKVAWKLKDPCVSYDCKITGRNVELKILRAHWFSNRYDIFISRIILKLHNFQSNIKDETYS